MGLFDKLLKKDENAASTTEGAVPETNDAHLVTPIAAPTTGGELTPADIARSPIDLPSDASPDAATSQLAAEPTVLASDEPVDALYEPSEDNAEQPVELPNDQPTLRAPIPFPSRAAATPQPPASQSPTGAVSAEGLPPQTLEELRNNPNYVRVFDQYGQEVFLTRDQWRTEVLPQNLQAHWNSPDELYAVLVAAMNDSFFQEIEPASAHFQQIDTNLVRGACVRAVVLLQIGRMDEAEAVLDTYLAQHGPDPSVLINLARLYAERGETERRDTTLARVLELDPNSEQALAWSVALEQERGGEDARRAALERFAENPAAWRARLWLAKNALDAHDLPSALRLYRQSLTQLEGHPIPGDFLYAMSGDLGMAGRLRELLETTEPHFQAELHGLQVGNNLIKAHVDLGQFDQATDLVNRLFRLQQPAWRETLTFWDATITRARAATWQAAHPQNPNQPFEIGMLEMTGPVWKRRGGPLEAVFGSKPDGATLVTILGGTADLTPPQSQNGNQDQQAQQTAMQLADTLGRISRTMPLFLSEQIEFHSAAQARALLPRVEQGVGGFVLRGGEWTDAEALEFARNAELVPTFIVKSHVDARGPEWILTATVLRVDTGANLGTARASFPAGHLELAAPALSAELRLLLSRQGIPAEAPPAVYQLPEGQFLGNYLLRLEQLLAVRTAVLSEDGPPVLAGEREILEGTLFLAHQQPSNPTLRALMAQTFVAMSRIRPDILDEFDNRLEALEENHPIGEPLGGIIHEMTLE